MVGVSGKKLDIAKGQAKVRNFVSQKVVFRGGKTQAVPNELKA